MLGPSSLNINQCGHSFTSWEPERKGRQRSVALPDPASIRSPWSEPRIGACSCSFIPAVDKVLASRLRLSMNLSASSDDFICFPLSSLAVQVGLSSASRIYIMQHVLYLLQESVDLLLGSYGDTQAACAAQLLPSEPHDYTPLSSHCFIHLKRRRIVGLSTLVFWLI